MVEKNKFVDFSNCDYRKFFYTLKSLSSEEREKREKEKLDKKRNNFIELKVILDDLISDYSKLENKSEHKDIENKIKKIQKQIIKQFKDL